MLGWCVRVCVTVLLLSGTIGLDGCSSSGGGGSAGAAGGPSGTGGGSAGATGAGGTGGGSATGGTSGGGSGGGPVGGRGGAGGAAGGGGTPGQADAAAGGRDAGSPPDAPLPLCNYPDWSPTVNYKVGDVVMFMGKPYVATHDNIKLDPTISTFFWDPFTGCRVAPPADGPLPLCNYPNWSRTVAYKTGDIVMFMGKPYVAAEDNLSNDPTISTAIWRPYQGCTPPPPPPPPPPMTCALLDKLLPSGEATFKAMFAPPFQSDGPLAAYSYGSLCKALDTPGLNAFARSGNDTQDKRELAGFFANVAIETGYLTAIDEAGHSASDGDYHGRGSLQITTPAIYSEAGAFLGLNLSGQPQLGSQEIVVWQTGIWYWTIHANPGAVGIQICHNAIAQGEFGQTVRIILGGCGSAPARVAQYLKNCMLLGVPPGNTTCN
jgi:predicted chitinase